MDLNKIAKDITEVEGKKTSLSVAQVKEVIGILLGAYSLQEVTQMWFKKNKVKV